MHERRGGPAEIESAIFQLPIAWTYLRVTGLSFAACCGCSFEPFLSHDYSKIKGGFKYYDQVGSMAVSPTNV